MKHTLCIFNETKQRIPRTLLSRIYTDLLKRTAPLNLVFIGNSRAKKLNETYRKKRYTPSILTFPGGGLPSEMYINIQKAADNARHSNSSLKEQIIFLYIHGILHLLGFEHGGEMETWEDKYTTKYIYTR